MDAVYFSKRVEAAVIWLLQRQREFCFNFGHRGCKGQSLQRLDEFLLLLIEVEGPNRFVITKQMGTTGNLISQTPFGLSGISHQLVQVPSQDFQQSSNCVMQDRSRFKLASRRTHTTNCSIGRVLERCHGINRAVCEALQARLDRDLEDSTHRFNDERHELARESTGDV